MRLPSARATKNGSPPTDPKARTGEFTPPGMRACARSNQLVLTGLKRFGELACEVREDDLRARTLDREQVLTRDGGAIEPSKLGGRPHHRVFAAHVVRRDRH